MPASIPHSRTIGIPAFLITITWISVCLRVWIRGFIIREFGLEDWLLILALSLFTVLESLAIRTVYLGEGQHINAITLPQLTGTLKLWFVGTILYVLVSITVKLSVALLLLRLAADRKHRIGIWITTTLNTLVGTAFLFAVLFQCRPIAYFWDKTVVSGVCYSARIFTAAAYINAVVGTTADFAYASIPVWMIWNLKISRTSKVAVCFVLGLGAISGILGIVRTTYIKDLNQTTDITYDFFGWAVWNTLEVGTGIVAASLATARPLLRQVASWFKKRNTSRLLSDPAISRSHTISTKKPHELKCNDSLTQ